MDYPGRDGRMICSPQASASIVNEHRSLRIYTFILFTQPVCESAVTVCLGARPIIRLSG